MKKSIGLHLINMKRKMYLLFPRCMAVVYDWGKSELLENNCEFDVSYFIQMVVSL